MIQRRSKFLDACLTGGPVLAVNAAIASLASGQHLSVGEGRGTPAKW